MKLAIIGSRNFSDYNLLVSVLDKFRDIKLIISGGAIGADLLAERYADERGIPKLIIKPDYQKYSGKVAPIKRNDKIANQCDQMVAFWDGDSKGTRYAFNKCAQLGKPTYIINCLTNKITRVA